MNNWYILGKYSSCQTVNIDNVEGTLFEMSSLLEKKMAVQKLDRIYIVIYYIGYFCALLKIYHSS